LVFVGVQLWLFVVLRFFEEPVAHLLNAVLVANPTTMPVAVLVITAVGFVMMTASPLGAEVTIP
jgi:hypothetical protein